MHASSERNRV